MIREDDGPTNAACPIRQSTDRTSRLFDIQRVNGTGSKKIRSQSRVCWNPTDAHVLAIILNTGSVVGLGAMDKWYHYAHVLASWAAAFFSDSDGLTKTGWPFIKAQQRDAHAVSIVACERHEGNSRGRAGTLRSWPLSESAGMIEFLSAA